MAVLHVRNIPDNLYELAQAIAAERGTTLSALVIDLMEQAANRHLDRKRHARALSRMRKNLAKRKRADTSAVELIHAVREEREHERGL